MQDGISIIICCYNSGWIIRRSLVALKQQQIRPEIHWEVVLVDNCCTDDTVAAAQAEMEKSLVNFRIVEEKNAGLAYARRKGINEVQYCYVIFCDDDNLLCPTYVQTMYDILQSDSTIGAVGGKGEAEFQSEPASVVKENLGDFAVGSQMSHKDWLYGAGVALRTHLVKDVYENQKCYLVGRKGNQLLSGDDSELVMSIVNRGYKVHPTDDVYYLHVLKANRLTEEYYERLKVGLELPGPAFMAMRCAMYGRSFKEIPIEYYYNFKSLFWSFIKHQHPDALDVRKRSLGSIRKFNFWGMYRLWKIYKEWVHIKNSYLKE